MRFLFGTREKYIQRIGELFKKKKQLDYLDIADGLGLELGFVVDVCKELERKGKIEEIEIFKAIKMYKEK